MLRILISTFWSDVDEDWVKTKHKGIRCIDRAVALPTKPVNFHLTFSYE